ncbi:MAG: CotH kinase family protein [Bacteroidia bacterium]
MLSKLNRAIFKMWLPFLLFFCFISLPARSQQQVLINEFVASNTNSLLDEDGDSADWIELYNPGSIAVNLLGWGISDNANQAFKWVFPAVSLQPGQFLIVWASGKNRFDSVLHTNFSISAAGEPLLLTDSNGNRIDSIGPVALGMDQSYGRQPDGGVDWKFFVNPTPSQSNNNATGYYGKLLPVNFSLAGGFYQQTQQLSLSSVDSGVMIIYTLDGSEPDTANLSGKAFVYRQLYPENPGDPEGDSLFGWMHSQVWQGPISLHDRSADSNTISTIATTYNRNGEHFPSGPIKKGTVVRAKAYKAGAMASETVTATYIIDSLGRSRYQLPVISLSASAERLFDYYQGIWVPGIDFDNWRRLNPNFPVDPGMPANYRRSGRAWEVEAGFEYFENGQSAAILTQQVGLRVHGDWGRALPSKNNRFYARSGYGNSHFNHQIFPDLAYSSYSTFLLRNADWAATNLRDVYLQRIAAPLGFETQANRPAILFVNGEYWGLMAQQERYDAAYFLRKYGIAENDLDILEGSGVAETGDSVHYNQLINFLHQNNLSDSAAYSWVSQQMDIENFTDYWLTQIFFSNNDWPFKNIRFWRYRASYSPGAGMYDGRWRWLLYDVDWGANLGLPGNVMFHTTSATAEGSRFPDWATLLVRSLLNNPNYRAYFISRFFDLLNTTYHPELTVPPLLSLRDSLVSFMPEHISRWNSMHDVNRWLNNVAAIENYMLQWPDSARRHMQERFGLDSLAQVYLAINDSSAGEIRVNSITVPQHAIAYDSMYWQGVYPKQFELRFQAQSKQGYRFSHWIGLPDSNLAIQSISLTTDSLWAKAVFVPDTTTPAFRSLMHYWHFNQLASGTLDSIPAHVSFSSTANISNPGTGLGYMDRVNDGSLLNARFSDSAGFALRVRNPSIGRYLLLDASSEGYQTLKLSYAASRTNNGAELHSIEYRTGSHEPWQTAVAGQAVTENYQLIRHDFSQLQGINNQPYLQFRFIFQGPSASASSGNQRFDNISIEGEPLPNPNQLLHYWHFNQLGSGTVSDVLADSSFTGNAIITYPGSGTGYMDRVNEGSGQNLLLNEVPGMALRLRNPAVSREMIFNSPVTGHKLSELSFSAMRTSNGPQHALLLYQVAPDQSWQVLGDTLSLTEQFQRYRYQPDSLLGFIDNPLLSFKLLLLPPNNSGSSGNVRIDNLAIWGVPDSSRTALHYWHFNDLASGTLHSILADSSEAGHAFIQYTGSGAGLLDRVNDGSSLLLLQGQGPGFALRVRNPALNRSLELCFSSKSRQQLRLDYTLKRTNNGPTWHRVEYLNPQHQWEIVRDSIGVGLDYAAMQLDLSALTALHDADSARLRWVLLGPEISANDGNQRFDNISLSAFPAKYGYDTVSICSNSFYLFGNDSLRLGGNYEFRISTDSISRLHLITKPAYFQIDTVRICANEWYVLPGGDSVNLPGVYTDSLVSSLGCDSVHTTWLQLDSLPLLQLNASICAGGSYVLPDGQVVSAAGSYQGQLSGVLFACDTLWSVSLQHFAVYGFSDTVRICANEWYVLPGGDSVNLPGVYTDSLVSSLGCDSVHTTWLQLDSLPLLQLNASICAGGSYVLPDGQVVSAAGSYQGQLSGVLFACDTLWSVSLQHFAVYGFSDTVRICANEWYVLPGGDSVNLPGVYTDSLVSSLGCDSVHTTWLQLDSLPLLQLNASICAGGSYVLPDGQVVSAAGSYQGRLAGGSSECDTLWQVNLQFNPSYLITDSVQICDSSFYVLPGGDTVSMPGLYIDSLLSEWGCDSIIYTWLQLDSLIRMYDNFSLCAGDSLLLPNGHWVSQAGQYQGLIPGFQCDTLWVIDVDFDQRASQPSISRQNDTLYAGNAPYYFWFLNNIWLAGDSLPYLIINQNGSYRALADSAGCLSDTSLAYVVTGLWLNAPETLAAPRVYPNPSSGKLYLRWPELPVEAVYLQLYDSRGRQLMYLKWPAAAEHWEVDLHHLAQGSYSIRISTVRGNWHFRQMIIH